jgi:O-antigen/teichoic acid export membrane protein
MPGLDGTITLKQFARFYVPLVATSYLLTSTNPLLAAALARTADPATALAGYGVAFALIGVIYAPLLVVQQVAAQRLISGGDIQSVRRFTAVMGVALSIFAALVAFTPIGVFIFERIVGIHDAILDEALSAMTALWPVPLLTGIRAVHQGRLVAGHRTRPIALATGARTLVLGAVAFGLTTSPAGAWLGGVAFTAGLAAEALLVTFARAPVPEPHPLPEVEEEGEDRLISFSTPLMLNVMLWWSTPLIINSVLARTPEPDCSIAAFTVVEAVAWFLAAPVGQLQHASLALVQCSDTHNRVRRYAGGLALLVTLFLGVLAFPAVREIILWTGFRLDPSLLEPAGLAFPVAALYPLLYGHRQYYQGMFVRAGCTGLVGRSAVLRIVVILAAAPLLLGPMGPSKSWHDFERYLSWMQSAQLRGPARVRDPANPRHRQGRAGPRASGLR